FPTICHFEETIMHKWKCLSRYELVIPRYYATIRDLIFRAISRLLHYLVIMIQTVRGTRDILPEDMPLWHRVESVAREGFRRYGFSEIRTPIFEKTELFARGVGEGTDIVHKEMYTFIDRARADSEGESLTLRPENTTSVVRAYIQHKMFADKS